MHRGGKERRDSAGQPEQTGVVSTSPLTNCDTTSCHTRLNSAEARSRSTGNKLMFARRIWVVWSFWGHVLARPKLAVYTAKLIHDKATKRIEIRCAKIPRDIRYKESSSEEEEEEDAAIRASDGRPSRTPSKESNDSDLARDFNNLEDFSRRG